MTPRERVKFFIYTMCLKADDAAGLVEHALEETKKFENDRRYYLFQMQRFDALAERVVREVFSADE